MHNYSFITTMSNLPTMSTLPIIDSNMPLMSDSGNKLVNMLNTMPNSVHQHLYNAWKNFGPISFDDIIQKSQGNFDFERKDVEYKFDDRGQCYAIGQHKIGTNKLHGVGRWVNKSVWIGEGMWQHGWLSGFGRSLYLDGEYYLGMWKEGMREGFGVEISARGEVR